MLLFERLQWTYRAWRYRLKVEKHEVRCVLHNLRRGDVAVDIGAHKGGFSYWMKRSVGPSGSVYAFEPQPALASYLSRVLAADRDPHVTVENRALSSRCGQMTLTVPGTKPSPGATLENKPHSRGEACQQFRVSVTTLDDYFPWRAAPHITLIKCDAEGHELEIFRGGEQLLRHHRPTLLFECETRHRSSASLDDVFEFLAGLGYDGFFFSAGHLESIGSFDARVHQRDPNSNDYVNNFLFRSSENVPQRQAA